MCSGKGVWPLIAELANFLDGGRELSERKLDLLQEELRRIPPDARDEIRRQMIQLVAALSRLEVRMIDAHGPLNSVV